ncbi:MAG: MarR family transcriptional regulator [Actinomycetes bacterium]
MARSQSNSSDPKFLTHHALRIKGFSKSETLAEIVALDVAVVDQHLQELQAEEMAMFREARSLWQLTPAGRAAHPEALAKDVAGLDLDALKPHYHSFLEINDTFKHLCGDWQLRDGAPNDHSDDKYDQEVIKRLVTLHDGAKPVVSSMATIVPRLSPYVPRLDSTCKLVVGGANNMFTGVMCGSFHDVWMELHEDLILSQGIDRAAEGSF